MEWKWIRVHNSHNNCNNYWKVLILKWLNSISRMVKKVYSNWKTIKSKWWNPFCVLFANDILQITVKIMTSNKSNWHNTSHNCYKRKGRINYLNRHWILKIEMHRIGRREYRNWMKLLIILKVRIMCLETK
jgi:hypothetical protein